MNSDYRDRQERLRGVLAAMGCPIPADQHILGFAGVAFTSSEFDYQSTSEISTRPIVAVPKERAEDDVFEKFLITAAAEVLVEQGDSDQIGLIVSPTPTE